MRNFKAILKNLCAVIIGTELNNWSEYIDFNTHLIIGVLDLFMTYYYLNESVFAFITTLFIVQFHRGAGNIPQRFWSILTREHHTVASESHPWCESSGFILKEPVWNDQSWNDESCDMYHGVSSFHSSSNQVGCDVFTWCSIGTKGVKRKITHTVT